MPIDKSITNGDSVEKILDLLKNNKDTVKKITDAKLLPSSYRLYLRSLAGITDPVDESFFKNSELDMMRKKIGRSEISKETKDKNYPLPKNTIGYGNRKGKNLTVLGALTDDETNIDMTLGKASFNKDKEGNYILNDTYDFDGVMGGGYGGLEGKAIARMSGSETDKDLIGAAIESYKNGEMPLAQVARIIGGLKLGADRGFKGVPVKINLGQLTEDNKKESIKLDRTYQTDMKSLKEDQSHLDRLNNAEKNPKLLEFSEPYLKDSLDYTNESLQDYKKEVEKDINDRIMKMNNKYGKYSPYFDSGVMSLKDVI